MLAMILVAGLYVGRSTAGRTHRYPAVVRCKAMAEDTAAHVKLVKYEHDGATLVYRCVGGGY